MNDRSIKNGAMAIIRVIREGILGDWSLLSTKAVLDFIIIMAMICSLGKGCAFSAIPVLIFEGLITVFVSILKTKELNVTVYAVALFFFFENVKFSSYFC